MLFIQKKIKKFAPANHNLPVHHYLQFRKFQTALEIETSTDFYKSGLLCINIRPDTSDQDGGNRWPKSLRTLSTTLVQYHKRSLSDNNTYRRPKENLTCLMCEPASLES